MMDAVTNKWPLNACKILSLENKYYWKKHLEKRPQQKLDYIIGIIDIRVQVAFFSEDLIRSKDRKLIQQRIMKQIGITTEGF